MLCLFEGEVKTIDIHEHTDTMHFGVTPDDKDPGSVEKYTKEFRDLKTNSLGAPTPLPWKSTDKRTRDIFNLAQGQATNSAEFGFTMIAGAEKVRFSKS